MIGLLMVIWLEGDSFLFFMRKCIKSTSNLLTFDIVFSIILVGTFFLYSPFYRTWEIL